MTFCLEMFSSLAKYKMINYLAWFKILTNRGSGSFEAKERVSCLILSAFKGGKERSSWFGLLNY